MICADTSVLIAASRDSSGPVARHLADLIETDDLLVPLPVRIELMTVASKRVLPDLVDSLSGFSGDVPGPAVWQQVEAWVSVAVSAGQRFGLVDLLIAASAAEHEAAIWSLDADFVRMHRLGFVKLYTPPSES